MLVLDRQSTDTEFTPAQVLAGQVEMGAVRLTPAGGSPAQPADAAILRFGLQYGDPFNGEKISPFSSFSGTVEMSSLSAVLTQLGARGIITAIGVAQTHMEVMEMPDRISKSVLARGLDTNTAFAIVSIDIADIDIGENIGARLQNDQAEAAAADELGEAGAPVVEEEEGGEPEAEEEPED